MNQYYQTVRLERQLTPGTAHDLTTRGFPSKTSIMAERIFSPMRSQTSATLRENTLPQGSLILFEPTRRTLSNDELLKAQLKHTDKHTIPTFYPTNNEKVTGAKMFFEEKNKSLQTPTLHQSFPPKYAGPIGRKKVHKSESSTQTEKTLYKRQLNGLTEYSTWMFAEVDPFMQSLRESLLSNRPQNIPLYVQEFCGTYGTGEPPKTVVEPKLVEPKA